ncbi:MAG: helix-turn-helix domain-containing protein [Sedimentibacter sp.]
MEDVKIYRVIGQMMRDARTFRGMTLDQIANKMNVTIKTIQRYELGERKITIGTLVEIIEILGLDYSSFMNEVYKRSQGDKNEP